MTPSEFDMLLQELAEAFRRRGYDQEERHIRQLRADLAGFLGELRDAGLRATITIDLQTIDLSGAAHAAGS